MTKSQRLQPVTRVAELRERNAAKALGQSRHRLSETEARLEELLAYREEYARRLQTAGGEGMNAREVSEYHNFLARLNEAITHQQARLAQAHQDYESRRSQWQSQRTHTLALDKVVERYRRQEEHTEGQREQRESDDRTRDRGNGEY
jgi:flagellar FliJ protein